MASAMTAPHSMARDLVLGFIAGAVSIVLFHQIMILILTQVGLIQGSVYSMRPVAPWSVPQIINQMFWGGLWGAVFAAIFERLPRHWPLVVAGGLFGVVGPLLVAWFVVAPIKGQALAAGFSPTRMLAGVLIYLAFGAGIALIYAHLRGFVTGRPPAMRW